MRKIENKGLRMSAKYLYKGFEIFKAWNDENKKYWYAYNGSELEIECETKNEVKNWLDKVHN